MKKSDSLNINQTVDRRQFLRLSALGLAGLNLSAFCTSCGERKHQTSTARQPNILLFVADDAGWNDVGYHNPQIDTPNIDRLALQGVQLDHFYVCPTCSPTRASLLTGRPASRFGILGPIAGRSRLALPLNSPTLAQSLHASGYATAITGKWHLGLRPEVGPNHYGFEHCYGYLHGQIDQYTHEYKNGDRSWHRNGEFIEETGHATDLIADEAIRFIRQNSGKNTPFFLYVPFSVPHYPLQEPEEWTQRYRTIENESRRLFAASMTHADAAIGRILQALSAEQMEEETLVIFFSDNGGQKDWNPTTEYNMRHGPNDRLGDNTPLCGWKGQLYEGGIRVPAVFYWHGILAPRVLTEVTHVIDIFPTLAALANAPIPN
ncbi:sulfatase-like hydrolase/transferase, partial [candidate division KSB1 bacterium]|nr:sulfatase-like hydrolase/transferase [candidate division KSB1 bacterium]